MKLSYRPEIDGLRAIAVLSVVLYHSDLIFNNFKIFKGGFLGVDIFFTISGYLITSILLKEQFQNKKISLINFYKRRIKRILPTLLIVILTSSILSIFILLPESMEKFAKTVQFSISFLSNIFFWYSQTVYGAEESFLSPLLHTWSLSVEEQFYIFYPLLIIFILSYIKKNFFITMILIFILSLILSIFGNYFVPSFNFFALPTRAWEFIAGGIIAYLEIKKRNHIRNKNLLSLLGLFMIVLSIFYFDRELQHPSLFTLIPVFGTCLIIYFSNFRLCLVKDLLSNNILVYVGLISYSIYLWHFPLFSFAKHLGFYELKVIKVIIIAITFFFINYILQFYREIF